MKFFTSLLALVLLAAAPLSSVQAQESKPIKALLILGGCCHDYAKQKDILKAGLEKRLNIEVEIDFNPDRTTKARFSRFEKPDWAAGFDVVIHDECSADVKEIPYVQNILSAHQSGVASVNLHCAMHSYRTGTPMWFEYLGMQSTGHGPQLPIDVRYTDKESPITKGLADWMTIKEELYNNVKIWPTAKALASGKQGDKDFVVAWTHEYGKGRVFCTTLGHNNDTVGDDRYLDLVARGLLWSVDRLDADGKPKPGSAK